MGAGFSSGSGARRADGHSQKREHGGMSYGSDEAGISRWPPVSGLVGWTNG